MKLLGDLVTQMEKDEANLTDPYRDHRKRPLNEHVADYLDALAKEIRGGKAAKHHAERRRVLKPALAEMKAGAEKTREDPTKRRANKGKADALREKILKGIAGASAWVPVYLPEAPAAMPQPNPRCRCEPPASCRLLQRPGRRYSGLVYLVPESVRALHGDNQEMRELAAGELWGIDPQAAQDAGLPEHLRLPHELTP